MPNHKKYINEYIGVKYNRLLILKDTDCFIKNQVEKKDKLCAYAIVVVLKIIYYIMW